MNDLQGLDNKFVRNVEEEKVAELAKVIFGDTIITSSLPKPSKKPATLLFDRQPQKRWPTFPSPVAEESSDNKQLVSEITSADVPALLTALRQYGSETGLVQSLPLSAKSDPPQA